MKIPELRFPSYPFLAALVPVLLYYNTQATQEIPLDGLLAPCAVAIGLTSIVYLVPCLVLRLTGSKSEKWKEISARLILLCALWMSMLWLVVYSPTFVIEASGLCRSFNLPFDPLSLAGTGLPILWVVLFGISLFPLIRRPLLEPLTVVLQNAFWLLFLLQVAATGWFLVRAEFAIKPHVEAIQKEVVIGPAQSRSKQALETLTQKPDIYYLILDEMASSGVLKEYLHYDDTWFRKALEERGFLVTSKSLSNYPLTRLSISSSMNMMYLDRFAEITGANNADLTATAFLMRDSALAKLLKMEGYKYIHVDSAVPPSDNSYIADTVLHHGLINQFSDKFFRSTIISLSPPMVAWLEQQARDRILWQFDITASIAARKHPASVFVFTHILCPHEPFLFDADGKPVFNAGDREGTRWTRETSLAYVAQAEFAQKKTIETIDSILKQGRDSGKAPIIVVQGDHGTHSSDYVSSDNPTDALLHERFGILNAYFVPPEVKSDLSDATQPVNTFRIIMRRLFGLRLSELPEKQFYVTYGRVFDFKDVTENVREGTPIFESPRMPNSSHSNEPYALYSYR